MAAGLAELPSVPEKAMPAATRHMTFMALAWTAYLGAFLARSEGLALRPDPALAAVAFGLAAFVLLVAGAAHGGQLVYRLGVGVELSHRDA
jgi:uncharacterized membrane protein